MKAGKIGWLLGAALCAWGLQAAAQTTHLNLHEMNFDMWCQEHQKLPPERCDKRLPADDAAFQNYVDTIERYETQKLNNQAKERRIGHMIDRADSVDHPLEPSTPPADRPPPQ
ncbi:MAG: hypothetical protein ACLQUZ_16295 [Rhizomicrobium sp.]